MNLKFLVEGEEETGAPDLAELVAANRSRLGADLVVFFDNPAVADRRPPRHLPPASAG